MAKRMLYRIMFTNQDIIYEIYARKICESAIFGFLEIEEVVFGENTSLVVDPSEERLKIEFQNVNRTYIPMHTILRIDEVNKQGIAKIRHSKDANKVSLFPIRGKTPE